MNKKIVLLVLAALLIFSFGCIGGQQTQENQQTKYSKGQSTTDQQSTQQQEQQSSGEKQEGGLLKISEVFGSTVPYECVVKSKDPSVPVTTKTYIKGEKMKSVMTVVFEGKTTTNEVIVPGDGYAYVRLSTPINNCEWMKIQVKKGDPETNPSDTLRQYEEATKWEYSCTVGTFGDDIFTKPTKACTQEEMIGSVPSR
ncbi:MAG: hypothetical protein QW153_00200 [Candidatus Bilamarchaeaceae archaeon]